MFNQQPPSPPPSNDGDVKLSPQALSQTAFQQQAYRHNQPQQQYTYTPTSGPFSYSCLEAGPSIMDGAMIGYGSNSMYQSMTSGDCTPEITLPILSYPRAGEIPRNDGVDTLEDSKDGIALPKSGDEKEKVRVMRPARLRRRSKPAKADKGDGPMIDAPLSVLTKDMPHIPIRDMEAWVNRSAEVRLEEVKMKNGKIARPMNSFMLYRSAFAERTKEWCKQNNHQVVSRASGQSWPLEPREVRDLYERFATIERDNHHKAHPEYKFAPNKNQNALKTQNGLKTGISAALKRKRSRDDPLSDFEDQPYDITSHPRAINRRRTVDSNGDASYSRTPTPCDNDSTYESRHSSPMGHPHVDMYPNGGANLSSWEIVNPGRPHPGILSPPQQTHYYQPSIHQGPYGSNIEDVTYKKIGMPGLNYEASGPLTTMSNNGHAELLHTQSLAHSRMPVSMTEAEVDPQLLAFDRIQTADNGGNFESQPDFWPFPQSNNQHYVHNHGYMSAPEPDQYHHAPLPPTTMASLMNGRELCFNAPVLPPPTGEDLNEWFGGSTVN